MAVQSPERESHGVDVFVGRERELAILDAALAAASEARGGVVLFAGEPGIGKTRLIDEFARAARNAGATVVVGRCYEGDGAPPFWPWVEALRAVVAGHDPARARELGDGAHDLAQIVPGVATRARDVSPPSDHDVEQARFRLFDGVLGFLRRVTQAGPLVVVLDDLQDADTPSLRLLEFVARAVSQLRILVVGTCRDEALGGPGALATTVAELVRGAGHQVHALRGFDATTLARYIAVATGAAPSSALVAAVQARTDGNPLYVTEIVRLLSADGDLSRADGGTVERLALPPGVRAVIARRVSKRTPACASVLELAALYGREFDERPLVHLADLTAEQLMPLLKEAVDAKLIDPVPGSAGRYRFAHALVRDAFYGAVRAPRRPALHRKAGEALAAVSAGERHPPFPELAAQFHAAGDPRAVAYARAAGDRALALLAHEEAVHQYAAAVAMAERTPEIDDQLRCELLLSLADAQRRANDLQSSRETVLTAAESARRRGAAEQLARAALTFGADFAWGDAGTTDPVRVTLLEEALAASHDEETETRVRLLGRLAIALFFDTASATRRAELGEEALTRARRLADPRLVAFAVHARHITQWTPENARDRMALADELVALAELQRDRGLLLEAHSLRLSDLLELDDTPGFDATLATVIRLAAELREGIHRTLVGAYQGTRRTMQGRFAETEALAREVAVNEQRVWPGRPPVVSGIMMYAVARLRGDLGTMLDGLKASVAIHAGIPALRFILAYACMAADRDAEARHTFERIAEHDFADLPRDIHFLFAATLASEVCTFIGDDRRSAILFDLLRPYARCNAILGGPMEYAGPVTHYLGKLATSLGRYDEARRHFDDALAREQSAGALPWVALTRYEYGMMLRARATAADRAAADDILRDALRIADALGMLALRGKILAASRPRETVASPGPDPSGNVFRREGEYWTIRYLGASVRLRDTKGLHYIARLIAEPGRDIHVLDLAIGSGDRADEPTGGARRPVEHAGAILDRRAIAEYKERLDELRADVDAASRANDLGRAERARHEIDRITEVLGAAYGLRGRLRTFGDPAERARKAVTNQIRRTVERITREHAALGRHLANALRTGFVCTYRPEQPVAWQLSV